MQKKVIIFISKNYLLEQKVQKLHLIASRSVEPGEIMTKYKIESETWGLQFIKWLSPTSFAFKLAGNNSNWKI